MTFYNFVLKLFRAFTKTFFKFEVIGIENIPSEGKTIIAANHKSNFDPIFVACAVNKKRKMTAIGKEELFKNKLLSLVLNKLEIIPINRENPGLNTIKRILKYIKNEYALVMFPEGTRTKGEDFSDAKAGISLFAIKGKAVVVPCTIYSSYKLFMKLFLNVIKQLRVSAQREFNAASAFEAMFHKYGFIQCISVILGHELQLASLII